MVIGVLWRKNDDDLKVDGENLKCDVVVMHKNKRAVLDRTGHVPVPKRVHITAMIWNISV